MPMSARILKIRPEFVDRIKSILTEKGQEHIYGNLNEKEKLGIYVKEVREIDNGFKALLYIDTIVWFTRVKREDGELKTERIPVLTTNKVEIIYYYRVPREESIENIIAVCPASLSKLFIDSITKYLTTTLGRTVTPFSRIEIIITKDNEDKLRRMVDSIVRIRATDLEHDKITSLGLGGPDVSDTEEWKKAFHDYGGHASSIAFRYKGYWIMVSKKGIIFSLSKDIELIKEKIIYEVLEILYKAGAIKIRGEALA